MAVVRRLCNLLIGVLVGACSAGAPVRVLDAGQTAITGSIGGPFVTESSPVGFVPYTTAGVAHGVSGNVTVHGNAHVLMGAFTVLGLDAGASIRALRGSGWVPEITTTARVLFFTDFYALNTMRLYPDLQATCSWEVADRTLVYAGTHGTFQFDPYQFLLSPMAGLQFPISDGVSLQGELIWQAANINTRSGVFTGQSSIGGSGSLGGFIGGVIWL